ncbi:MAG: hypothetical protein A49_22560 [Methyloceanibacter sp.]|nr:MAG: hypothetical protein A49_22560 [Methyloceanibacter sp.]
MRLGTFGLADNATVKLLGNQREGGDIQQNGPLQAEASKELTVGLAEQSSAQLHVGDAVDSVDGLMQGAFFLRILPSGQKRRLFHKLGIVIEAHYFVCSDSSSTPS